MYRILGTVVCVGLTTSQLPVSPFTVAIRGLKVLGSSVGTEVEMEEPLEMAVKGSVVPHIEIFELSELDDVVQRLAKAQIIGRAVMKIPA
jgi:propanol-preferring alcohol dehydrogenase